MKQHNLESTIGGLFDVQCCFLNGGHCLDNSLTNSICESVGASFMSGRAKY